MFKNIVTYLIILSLWFFSSVFFPFNEGFYNSLELPSYTPPGIVFGITWIILYALISYSIYRVVKKDGVNNDYLFVLIINYIFNQAFSLFFFNFNNLFLSLVSVIVTLVSGVFLLIETKKIDKISFYTLIPYLLWCLFASVLFTNVYLIN